MNDIANKDTVKRVRTALNLFDKNLKIQILENSARTALDASKALDCEVGAIVKSLVLRRKNSFLICLVSGDKKCSLNKVKRMYTFFNFELRCTFSPLRKKRIQKTS